MGKPDLFNSGAESAPEIHWHRCLCGFRWGHAEDKAGSVPHHTCRECGDIVWAQDGEHGPAKGAAKSRGNVILCDGPVEHEDEDFRLLSSAQTKERFDAIRVALLEVLTWAELPEGANQIPPSVVGKLRDALAIVSAPIR